MDKPGVYVVAAIVREANMFGKGHVGFKAYGDTSNVIDCVAWGRDEKVSELGTECLSFVKGDQVTLRGEFANGRNGGDPQFRVWEVCA